MATIPMTAAPATAPTEERRRATHRRAHRHCFVCGDAAPGGLGLRFSVGPDGVVATDWCSPPDYQSYDDILHGGLIVTLLDSAMVQALFARGVVARTAELRVRYHRPVRTGEPVAVAARLDRHFNSLYCLEAEVRQQAVICATAQAKFMASAPASPVVAELPAGQTSPRAKGASSRLGIAPAASKEHRHYEPCPKSRTPDVEKTPVPAG